jgi:hypothetical protein
VATWSEVWTVFVHSNAGIVGSNPIRGMDVCVYVYSVFVLSCVQVAASQWADHSSKGIYCLCNKDYITEEETRAQQKAVESFMIEWMKWSIKLCIFLSYFPWGPDISLFQEAPST